jgi:hypothetical protein
MRWLKIAMVALGAPAGFYPHLAQFHKCRAVAWTEPRFRGIRMVAAVDGRWRG